jgi:hypothetical protein
VPELAVVGGRFHLKPLFPAVEAHRHCYVLALSQDGVKVYETTPESLSEVVIPDLPPSPLVVQTAGVPERLLQSHTAARRSSTRRIAIFHGHGAAEEDRKHALLVYFRRVDEAVCRRFGDEWAPLVLAGADNLRSLYGQVSTYPMLLADSIHGNPGGLTAEALRQKAWMIAAEHFRKRREDAATEYGQSWHTSRASRNLPDIITAAHDGRVKTLFVAVGVQNWAHLDSLGVETVPSGEVTTKNQDLLNIVAMETFVAGGTVYAVPPEEVPGHGSVAAVFRY